MIASLRGLVQSIQYSSIVLDVAGVGYLVHSTSSLCALLTAGETVQLHTALVVREDSMTVFGFETVHERELFDLLRSVSGVGPKSSLAILSALNTDRIFDAVSNEDDAPFRSVSGIGPKTAKLIIVSLAGKLRVSQASSAGQTDENLVLALVGLGYAERSARAAINEVSQAASSPQQILKDALAVLSKQGR